MGNTNERDGAGTASRARSGAPGELRQWLPAMAARLDAALVGAGARIAAVRPWVWVVVLVLASTALFTHDLHQPDELTFDEVHYVPAARALAAGEALLNREHPLMAKQMMAWSITLFGDHPAAWRAPSVLMGVVSVLAVFALAFALVGRADAAMFAGVCALTNHFVFVHARLAMLDGIMAGFLLAGAAVLALSARAVWGRWIQRAAVLGAGVLLGLAVASKWAAAPYLAAVGVAIITVRVWETFASSAARGAVIAGMWRSFAAPGVRFWRGVSVLEISALMLIGAAGAYAASFLGGFGVAKGPLSWETLGPYQLTMFERLSSNFSDHVYASAWWSWPLMLRPIWYHYVENEGVLRAIFLVGNPVTMLLGVGATLACAIWGTLRRDGVMLVTGAIALFAIAHWALIPRELSFYYYYHVPATLLAAPITVLGVRLAGAQDRRLCAAGRWGVAIAFLAMMGMFAYFHPVLAAQPLTGEGVFLRWAWFRSWI